MENILDFKSLAIKLASPEEIREWSHGEVVKPETINYRTLRPEKDGLFCERIFGPTKDWECYCGKYKKIRYKGIICDKCGVEVTQSRVRRERMGHITLATPVAHIWFFKGSLSSLSLLLDMPPKLVETVVYFGQYLVTEVDTEKRKEAQAKLQDRFQELAQKLKESYREKIALEEKKLAEEKKRIKQEIKGQEQQAIALKEASLRTRQKIQAIRDEQVLETERQNQTQAALADRVKTLQPLAVLSEEEHLRLAQYQAADFFKVGMGAESLLQAVNKVNLTKLAEELNSEFKKSAGAKHLKIAKRLRLVEGMRKAKVSPAWTIIKILPVIPPDLRPMVQLTGGRFATSDLNDLYRRVINRNNRLKHLMDLGAPEIILRNEKRMLQEAVDNLIDSSRWVAGRRTKTPVLRSLSDMLRGKQGRFRQNLLGKRVDYSGRSVIVVGPELSLDQCGLPKEMALEMFKPYVLREMILRGVAPNVRSAKNILERKPAEVFDILEEITRHHPVFLNRAPTLHKLGIQAFYPVLVEGAAIRLHPCVCAGFNADFDGDQMAVHIPLSEEACWEAKNLMMARQNLLKPSDGSPISIPDAKEMAVGVYYLTSVDPLLKLAETVFADREEAIFACQTGQIRLRQPIRVRLNGQILETTPGRLLFNEALPKKLDFLNEPVRRGVTKSLFARAFRACTNEEIVNLIDSVKNLGFEAGTVSGHSLSVFDCQKLPEKDKIIGQAEKEAEKIEKNFNQGLITDQEKRRLTQEVWIAVTEELAEKTWASFTPENPVKMVMDAGVGRVSKDQVKQLSAMRGLGVDPLGKIVPLPVKSNFRDGLASFEFVTGARSSRKGLTDTALKTADAGYLTRRLVDVAHGAIIREKDCKTEKGIEITREGPRAKVFFARLLGRLTAAPVADPKTKKVLLAKGAEITEEALGILEKAGVEKVLVRSPLTCQTRLGLCAACYGWNFANKKMVEVGTPAGVLAAQSIGEPGTQLTLRTKHVGGVVGLDVTQGLPRVEELFEIRLPKTPSPLAEVAGKVALRQLDEGFELKIKDKTYLLPPTSNLLVEDGQKVEIGAQLAAGTLDIREILRVKGLRAAQEYLLAEVQAVYESQGIPINDKHFEVIIACMSQKVRIMEPGESEFLPGELVDKLELAKVKAKKVVAEEIILGLTRASILTNSWLSAASFQETTNVLTEAALKGKEDPLLGLKENVIIGRLIPTSPDRAKLKS